MKETILKSIERLAKSVVNAQERKKEEDDRAIALAAKLKTDQDQYARDVDAANAIVTDTMSALGKVLTDHGMSPSVAVDIQAFETGRVRPLATIRFAHSSGILAGNNWRVNITVDLESIEDHTNGYIAVSYWVGDPGDTVRNTSRTYPRDFDRQWLERVIESALDYVITRVPFDMPHPA